METALTLQFIRKLKLWRATTGILLLASALFCGICNASENTREWTIKAAYLFRLSLFVDWPEEKLESFGKENVRFCIAGNDEGVETIKKALTNKFINRHRIEVVGVDLQNDLLSCHVLYLSKQTRDLGKFLDKVANDSVLTIGDTDEFYRQGGIVLLFEKDNRIHFAINAEQLDSSGIKVRAQLLNLAEQYP